MMAIGELPSITAHHAGAPVVKTQAKISLRRITAVLAAGFIGGILAVALAIGNATLLARGDLVSSVTSLVSIILLAAAVLPMSTAYFSAIPGQVTTTQAISVVALGTVVGG